MPCKSYLYIHSEGKKAICLGTIESENAISLCATCVKFKKARSTVRVFFFMKRGLQKRFAN